MGKDRKMDINRVKTDQQIEKDNEKEIDDKILDELLDVESFMFKFLMIQMILACFIVLILICSLV